MDTTHYAAATFHTHTRSEFQLLQNSNAAQGLVLRDGDGRDWVRGKFHSKRLEGSDVNDFTVNGKFHSNVFGADGWSRNFLGAAGMQSRIFENSSIRFLTIRQQLS